MQTRKPKFSALNTTTKEGNARAGYCATAFFACASDIPAVVAEALPDGMYCTLDDMQKAMRRVEKQLLALNTSAGKHYVMVQVKEAKELILTLVLADTSVGLDEALDPVPAITAEHNELKKTVDAVKKILGAAQSGDTSYEEIREELDKLPNPALTSSVLAYMDKKVSVVQSLAGPIDLGLGRMQVKEVASHHAHVVQGIVSGGYEEQTNTVMLEITDLKDADQRLFSIGHRISIRVLQEEHRVNLLLAQLAKVHVLVSLRVPRIPITMSSAPGAVLRTDLVSLDLLERQESLANIKTALIQQFNLDI